MPLPLPRGIEGLENPRQHGGIHSLPAILEGHIHRVRLGRGRDDQRAAVTPREGVDDGILDQTGDHLA